jgi:hypothetical protein
MSLGRKSLDEEDLQVFVKQDDSLDERSPQSERGDFVLQPLREKRLGMWIA